MDLRARQRLEAFSVQRSLRWRHNGHGSVSNHQSHDCLLNRLFRRRSKKTSKLRVTGLCAGNSPGTGEFPAQMANNAENGSIWWRHHACWWIRDRIRPERIWRNGCVSGKQDWMKMMKFHKVLSIKLETFVLCVAVSCYLNKLQLRVFIHAILSLVAVKQSS